MLVQGRSFVALLSYNIVQLIDGFTIKLSKQTENLAFLMLGFFVPYC